MSVYATLIGEGVPTDMISLAAKPSLGEIITIYDEASQVVEPQWRVVGPVSHKAYRKKWEPSLFVPVERVVVFPTEPPS